MKQQLSFFDRSTWCPFFSAEPPASGTLSEAGKMSKGGRMLGK